MLCIPDGMGTFDNAFNEETMEVFTSYVSLVISLKGGVSEGVPEGESLESSGARPRSWALLDGETRLGYAEAVTGSG
jgi:hypothetical protein